jgi:hypothetical protein
MATDAEVIVRKCNSAGRRADDSDSVITARWRRRHPARSVVSRRSLLLGLNLNPSPKGLSPALWPLEAKPCPVHLATAYL